MASVKTLNLFDEEKFPDEARKYPQKQPSRGVLRKRCSENMQRIYRRTPMRRCDFKLLVEITLLHGCSPVNLLHIFRTSFLKNTSRRLLLYHVL